MASTALFGLNLNDFKVYLEIAVPLVTLVGAIALPWTIVNNHLQIVHSRREEDTFYAAIDSIYYDIQKLIIAKPHLAHPEISSKTPEQRDEYFAFAYLTWNFIETISDYSKRYEFIRETWYRILEYEVALHAEWFLNEQNRRMFKPTFVSEIAKNHLPALTATESS